MSSNQNISFCLQRKEIRDTGASDKIAIRVSNLSKYFQIYNTPRDRLKQFVVPRLQRLAGRSPKQYFREFWALKDVSFEVKKGESVGIIGRNGSGKSTILQVICGTLTPTAGMVETNGRISALLELGSGFNPEFTGRENIYMSAAVLGLSKEEINTRFDEIAAFADIGDFIEQPVKIYSSGMYVRLAFAIAINVDPDILVVDEALSVGDARFQARCMTRINEFRDKGVSILFVSHDTETVKRICDSTIILDKGKIVNQGLAAHMTNWYLAFMINDFDLEKTKRIEGETVRFRPKAPGDMHSIGKKLTSSPFPVFPLNGHLVDCSIERAEHPEFNYFRHGDGNARIVSIGLYDTETRPIEYAILGQKITCRVEVEFQTTLLYHIVGMHIRDRRGIDIIAVNTFQEKLKVPPVKQGTRLTYLFSLPVELRPDNYSITVAVAYDQQKMEWMDWIDNALLFSVVDPDPGRSIFGVYYPCHLKVSLEPVT